jgi:hypothetical protein
VIFSLSKTEAKIIIPSLEKTDIICFFNYPRSVSADADLWWPILHASLSRKHSVFILEAEIKEFPQIDASKRWQVNEAWLWITPRGQSVILNAYPKKNPPLDSLRSFLMLNK